MNKEYYTKNGRHMDDAIYETKIFINELQKVQNDYFNKLLLDLNLNEEVEDWLFDYIYNSSEDNEYDGFEDYLNKFNQKYSNFVSKNDILYNPKYISPEDFTSTDIQNFDISSCNAEFETVFPNAYNNEEPFSLGLDVINKIIEEEVKNLEHENN